MNRLSRMLLLLPALAVLGACGGKETARAPMVALETSGPPLAVAGEYAGMSLEGSMERTCMAGVGTVTLSAVGQEDGFACEAYLKTMPTAKGRIPGVLSCSGDRKLAFTMRNLGPDQGVGIARENADSDMMIFFYHPSAEEAARRLPSVREDIAQARALRE